MRKVLMLPIFAALIAILSFLPQGAHAVTFTATQDGNWNDPATWGGASPPFTINPGDTVTIPSGITVNIPFRSIMNSGTINNTGTINSAGGVIANNAGGTITNTGTITTIGQLENFGGLITNTGTITSTNNIMNQGRINNSGTITGSGTIQNGGSITDNNGGLTNPPGIINNGGTISSSIEFSSTVKSTITNNGNINVFRIDNYGNFFNNLGASITIPNGGEIGNYLESVLENSGTITNSGFFFFHDVSALSNSGTVTNNAGGFFTNLSTGNPTVHEGVDNSGTITLIGQGDNSGSMTNTGTITTSDFFIADPNSSIVNSGAINISGQFTNSNSATLTNEGGITISNSGTLNNAGTIQNIQGTITNNAGSNIENNGGGTITNQGSFNVCTLNNSGTITNFQSTITNSGCTINNNSGGSIENDQGTFTSNGGIINNNGGASITNKFGGTINYSEGIVNNHGSIDNSAGITLGSGGAIDNIGTITNEKGGTITINAGPETGITNESGASIINNSGGTITIDTGTANNPGIFNLSTISNEGTITNNAGGYFFNDGTINNSSGSNIINSGGTIDNSGTIVDSCNVFINGPISGKQPVSTCPVAVPDSYTTTQNTPLTVPAPGVLANDHDQDGDTLTASVSSGPNDGTLTLNSDGSFTYVPNTGFFGQDHFQYLVNDAQGQTSSVFDFINVVVPTATTLASTLNPSVIGQSVEFDATVNNTNISDGETVTFYDGSTVIGTSQTSSSVASLITSSLSPGTHSITAVYAGDSTFTQSTSNVLIQTVIQTPQQVITNLINTVNGLNIDHGTANSLDAKLNAAMSSLNSGDGKSAKNQLNAFIDEVNAQAGKKINQNDATNTLLPAVQLILTLIH